MWLKHSKGKPDSYYQDVLHLAHGECYCHKETSTKGVPMVYVPWSSSNDNIDFFPEGFLWERGCSIARGDDLIVRTPKGREIQVQMWGNMPFISKDALHQILSDLPECHVGGRSGKPAPVPTAARVAIARVDLDHLKGALPKEELSKVRAKYSNLPDLYWHDDAEAIITPDRFDKLDRQVVQQPSKAQKAKLWELCSGSGALSARAREKRVPHLPPVDLRYGWYTQRRRDQMLILFGVLVVGVHCVFAAPNCALRGSMTANMPRDLLAARRGREGPGLQFLALVCFLQFLMGRHFLIENSGASKIFEESPLRILSHLGVSHSKLDQCMYGAMQDNIHIKKSTAFVSDCPTPELETRCDHSHQHLQLRGHGPGGSRTAAAAMYPKALCDSIHATIAAMRTTPQDGGRKPPSHEFVAPPGYRDMAKHTRWYIDWKNSGQLPRNSATRTYTKIWSTTGSPGHPPTWTSRVGRTPRRHPPPWPRTAD